MVIDDRSTLARVLSGYVKVPFQKKAGPQVKYEDEVMQHRNILLLFSEPPLGCCTTELRGKLQ